MDNIGIAEKLELLSKLLDIHGADPFKAKAFAAASFTIDKLPYPLFNTPVDKWRSIRGIGASVTNALSQLQETGTIDLLEELLKNTPPGVIEMLQIKGIGPKKIHTIWKEMGIESMGELLYACQENRLLHYKGFGEKTQEAVAQSIQFILQHQGHFLFAEIEAIFPLIDNYLAQLFGKENIAVTGSFRRQLPTIEELAYVVLAEKENSKTKFETAQPPLLLEEEEGSLLYQLKNGLRLRLYFTNDLPTTLFNTSCSEDFKIAFDNIALKKGVKTAVHDAPDGILFSEKGIPFVHPAKREKGTQLFDSTSSTQTVLHENQIRGLIHCHSTWSDGSNELEEMVQECMKRNWEYMVISDHSASAFYANGLSAERVAAQHQQIDLLNKRYAPFRIFKSIESDILSDGSLDYEETVLSSFDLVIASIHSNLRMLKEKATERLIRAIENPFTTILGHPTGRLLLSRAGYPIDHEKIIDACATNKVAIEINAHPRRLDLDWTWVDHALEKGVLLSINPDAHQLEGFNDIRYGILVAQKTKLSASQNLSSFSCKEFENWLIKRK
ncbi:MAG: DNA polymerase/3'-5' exonuclease PolX [Chitinophagaceae bacterium]|nr:DNA polymerase/3'-5' exonuclease PolX [Chitinophagaceae bacterium]